MIKEIVYRNKLIVGFFINSETAEITDTNGVVQTKKYIVEKNRYSWKGMLVYRIMMHTFNGYLKGMSIHHKDFDSLNDSLSNLQYLTNSEHHKIHNAEGHNFKKRCHSKETKQKMSVSHKGNKSALGYTHTDEAKRKISNAMKGQTSPNKGKACADDTKQKISISNTGKKFTNDHRQKISKALIGKRKGMHWWHKDGEKAVMSFEPPSKEWIIGRK